MWKKNIESNTTPTTYDNQYYIWFNKAQMINAGIVPGKPLIEISFAVNENNKFKATFNQIEYQYGDICLNDTITVASDLINQYLNDFASNHRKQAKTFDRDVIDLFLKFFKSNDSLIAGHYHHLVTFDQHYII